MKPTTSFTAPLVSVNEYVLKLRTFLKELDPKVLRSLAIRLARVLDKRDKTQTARSIQRLTDEMLPQWLLGIDPKLLLPVARRFGFTPNGRIPPAVVSISHVAGLSQSRITIVD